MDTKLMPVESAPLEAVVATNVRVEAAKRGLSQSAVARLIGVGQPSVNDRWRGKVPWKLAELEALADLFGVEAAALLKYEENAPAFIQTGAVVKLPRLDSNQQPSDYWRAA